MTVLAPLPPARSAPRSQRRPRTTDQVPVVSRRSYGPFTVPHWRRWTVDLILESGDVWTTEDWQDAFIEDVFAGYSEAWLVVPEGNGKTTLLAGLSLYHVEHRDFAWVPVAAASREQAEIMYRQAEGFVLRSDRLHASVDSAIQKAKGKRKTHVPRFTCLEGYRRINYHGGGRIQVFAADDRTGDGIIPTLGIIDEPHRQKDLSLYRTWTGKIAKRSGQIVAISTAGEPGSDFEETRERIRETATESRRDGAYLRAVSADRIVLHEYALEDGADPGDLDAVKRANPFSGVTIEMLAEKYASPTTRPPHWLRFVCNRPTRLFESWLGPDADAVWAAARDPWTFVDGARTFAGIDIGVKRDTSAVVRLQRRDETRWHAQVRIWTPVPGRPNDASDVMAHIRDLDAQYDLVVAGYDPRFFDVPAAMLMTEGIEMVEIPQSAERMQASYGSLYEAILGGLITHDGDDGFTRQILNGVARFSDRGFLVDKARSAGKVDAIAALAMAYDQALRHEEDTPSVYESRDPVIL